MHSGPIKRPEFFFLHYKTHEALEIEKDTNIFVEECDNELLDARTI